MAELSLSLFTVTVTVNDQIIPCDQISDVLSFILYYRILLTLFSVFTLQSCTLLINQEHKTD